MGASISGLSTGTKCIYYNILGHYYKPKEYFYRSSMLFYIFNCQCECFQFLLVTRLPLVTLGINLLGWLLACSTIVCMCIYEIDSDVGFFVSIFLSVSCISIAGTHEWRGRKDLSSLCWGDGFDRSAVEAMQMWLWGSNDRVTFSLSKFFCSVV